MLTLINSNVRLMPKMPWGNSRGNTIQKFLGGVGTLVVQFCVELYHRNRVSLASPLSSCAIMERKAPWSPTVILVDASSLIFEEPDFRPPYRGAREGSARFVRSLLRYAPIRGAVLLSMKKQKNWLSQQVRQSEWRHIVEVLAWSDVVDRQFDLT
jgi:hypothetical protein